MTQQRWSSTAKSVTIHQGLVETLTVCQELLLRTLVQILEHLVRMAFSRAYQKRLGEKEENHLLCPPAYT